MRLSFRSRYRIAALVLLMACGRGPAAAPPEPAGAQETPARPLNLTPLAGQSIPVLPLTMVVPDPALAGDSVYAAWRNRPDALRRADSIIGEALAMRGPEVQWILPPELRKAARRSPGMVGDPDQLGQAMMRDPRMSRLPDNFRANLRGLVAVAGNRYVMIPAALGFSRPAPAATAGAAPAAEVPAGEVQADLSVVLADVRNGTILWRTGATGRGATPALALEAAVATMLPAGVGP